MISEGLRKHAFWLYGVIIGLAIKDALETVGGHLMIPPGGALSMRDSIPETVRLLVLLLTSIQFYLGSVWFFDKFYERNQAAPLGVNNIASANPPSYALDFLFGLFHFIIFFGWALSIDTHSGRLRVFPILLIIILVYDSLWCRACKGLDTYTEIRKWTYTNYGVVVFAIAIYAVTYLIALLVELWKLPPGNFDFWARDPIRHRVAEVVAMIPVLIVSGIDIVGIVTDRQLIADWVLDKFTNRPESPPAPAV
jgi:hypothetical protein